MSSTLTWITFASSGHCRTSPPPARTWKCKPRRENRAAPVRMRTTRNRVLTGAALKLQHKTKGCRMLSVIFCSRAWGNPDSNLRRLLDSAVEYTTPEERKQLEFLIKFDDDDELRPPQGFES